MFFVTESERKNNIHNDQHACLEVWNREYIQLIIILPRAIAVDNNN